MSPLQKRSNSNLELAARKQVDLSTIPLFLSSQGTQLTPKEYREHYWNPACHLAGIEADVHQARHWLVTRSVRDIYETAKSKEEIERRLRGLIEYMKWKSEETLSAYQHYFDEQRNADTREQFRQQVVFLFTSFQKYSLNYHSYLFVEAQFMVYLYYCEI